MTTTGLDIISQYARARADKKKKWNVWPEEFTHRKSGKVYQPHNEQEEIFVTDTTQYRHLLLKGGEGSGKSVAGIIKTLNRLKTGCDGIMACVGAETMVNGIPIADITEPHEVSTLMGSYPSSAAYLKGKDDLFQVRLQSGHVAVVTKSHYFLTQQGWRRLSQLNVGDSLVVHDKTNDPAYCERRLNYEADYPANLHRYGELSNPEERYNQGISKQPFLQQGYPLGDVFSHLLLDCQSIFQKNYLNQGTSVGASMGGNYPLAIYETVEYLIYTSDKYQLLKLLDHTQLKWLEFLLLCGLLEPQLTDIFSAMLNDLFAELFVSLKLQSNQLYWQCLQDINLDHKVLQPYHNHNFLDDHASSFAYQTPNVEMFNYNASLAPIQEIKFERYGEFYDITIPGIGHYEGDGIIHHNSTDLPHLKKSLWPEFVNWCPPQVVVKKDRYKINPTWHPQGFFILDFLAENGKIAKLLVGGFKEDIIGAWEGPNVNFIFFDEARRHKTAAAIKSLDGRIRIPGPIYGERPQFYLTTTPRMNWLYDYFGPLQENDAFAEFKSNAFVCTLNLEENRENLAEGYVDERRNTLTENEAKIVVAGEWAEEDHVEKFINIAYWDNCKGTISKKHYPCVIALDASKGSESSLPDSFALVMGSRAYDNPAIVEVRLVKVWQPKVGELFYYGPVEEEVRRLCKLFPVVEVAYDPYQLHHFAQTMKREGIAYFREFTQQKMRFEADKQLLDLIYQERIRHDGDPILREHIDNADIKKYPDDDSKIRIVKRYKSLKIDAAVATSMMQNRVLFYSPV